MESETNVSQIVEHLFRQEAGKTVSALTGTFGLRNLELIEDAVQEALLKALRLWSYGTIPPNPAAWLMQVARNHALDNLRRDTRWHEKQEQVALQHELSESLVTKPIFSDEEIKDDQLRIIFACCHPALGRESQVALTLKLLCGFNVEEIARAFLTGSETIAKRLTRARERLRSNAVPFEIPSGPDLTLRLDSVLDVLYLLFNEGYNASQGDELIRRDLCDEAIRLTSLLSEHPAGNTPKTHALLALLLFQAARFSARIDSAGEMLLLQNQDRSIWDRRKISQAFLHLDRASSGKISEFHIQAGIAACHCAAQNYEATDWEKILLLYDLLSELNDSPVVALNRAVAVANMRGPEAGLKALEEIRNSEMLAKYYLFYAVRGKLHFELAHYQEAEENFRRGLALTNIPAEQSFLRKKLTEIKSMLSN
jgi:RNA polymerase sigma-70 factor (ECF subfamily)